MILGTRQFERVANVVTERISELLGARVVVLDDRGVVIAQSASYANATCKLDLVGFPFDRNSRASTARRMRPDLRLPIRLDGRSGEVIVTESEEGEAISPRLTRKLVEMIVNQTAAVAQLPNHHELKNK
ncbi:MAG: CdaR family transcriptional regulator, partial [Cyanobacteriota bacterium]